MVVTLVGAAFAGESLIRGGLDLKARAAGTLPPVLPLGAPVYDFPFATEAARDPELLQRQPESAGDASRLADELKEFRADLSRAGGDRAAELNEMAYQAAAALAYYFEDVISGRISETENRASASGNLSSIRGMVVHHSGEAARLLKSEAGKARALFHLHATRYAMGERRGESADALAKLAGGKLNGRLKARAELISALYRLDNGGGADKARAEGVLKRIAPSLSAPGQVAVRLSLARSLAGLSRGGKRISGAHASYRQYLAAASSKASSLVPSHRDQALRVMISIWRAGEGASIDWSKVPFNMSPFAASLETKAVVERAAIQDVGAGRLASAIKRYQGLSRSLAEHRAKGDVDLRILDLKRAEYAASKNPKVYESALIQTAKAYLDPGILGEGQEPRAKEVASEVTRRHKTLVHGELARVGKDGASNAERQRAIAMATNYLATISENQEIEDVKGSIAGLYAMSGQHARAVALYKELAETGNQANARRYWALAIRSQTVVAAWTEEAPWNGIKAGPAAERDELLHLYRRLAESDPAQAGWFTAAHRGLLEIAAGREEAAFSLWGELLKKDARGAHAASAAGTMLVSYRKASDWANLEQLARLCLGAKLAAVHRGAPVVAVDMLALALLEGGKQAIDQGQYAVAVTKLKEFVKNHPGAKRHDEGFFFLASAYRGNGQHPESIKTLVAFVERYPKSGYYHDALLNGGDWSAALAYEENVIFFHNRFVTEFAGDGEAQRVRVSLTDLYVGRALYAEAIGVLAMTSRAKGVDAAVRADALHQIMGLEERHGSLRAAAGVADRVIADQGAGDEQKAQAYALKARVAARAGRFDEVKGIESKLQTLAGGPLGQDALGEARYLLAMSQRKIVTKRYFNLALTDPLQTLKQRFGAFGQARQGFESVCAAGQTSFCAPAMHQLGRLSEEFMRSIEDIDVQDTLAKEVVASFKKYKQSVMNDATATAQKSDGRAVAVLSEGSTDPDWVQAVLWQNNDDWNFERVSGETGNAYIQWNQTEGNP